MFKEKFIVLIVACLLINACTGIKSNNGYLPVQESVDQLKVNVTSPSSAKSVTNRATSFVKSSILMVISKK